MLVLSKEVVSLLEEVVPVPETYPSFEVPVTNQTLAALYKELNSSYFGGDLPEARVRLVPLAKNFFGKTHISYKDSGVVDSYLITIAIIIEKDRKHVVDTMLHEMIHVWQWNEWQKSGNKKFLDDYKSFFASSDFNKRGHGPSFGSKATELNSLGFDITVSSDAPVDQETDHEYYALLAPSSKGSLILISRTSLEDRLPVIEREIEDRLGQGFIGNYTMIKTRDSGVLQGIRVKPDGTLPRTVKNLLFVDSHAEALVLSPHTEILGRYGISAPEESSGSLDPQVVQACQSLHKHRSSSFDTYLINVLLLQPGFKQVRGLSSMVYRYLNPERREESPRLLDTVPQEVIDYVGKDWEAITDIEIKRSSVFKYFVTDVMSGIRKGKVRDRDLEDLDKDYERYFEGRVGRSRFNKLLGEFLVKALLKGARESVNGRNVTEDEIRRILKEKVLEGTGIMESKEKKEGPREFSCVMAPIVGPAKEALEDLQDQIALEDLAGDGLEDDPHVTVLFGLKDTDLVGVEGGVESVDPFKLSFGTIEIFEPSEEDYDVVVVRVEGAGIHDLHDDLAEIPHTDTHPTYKPHATVAYVAKGRGKKYKDLKVSGEEFWVDHVVFSFQDREKSLKKIELES